MNPKRLPERGVALMLALFLTTFLFVLGLTMLYFIDRDARAGLNLQRSQQAQASAQSGMIFARDIIMNEYGSTFSVPSTPTFYAMDASNLNGFEIWKDSAIPYPTIHSVGLVRDASGNTLMRRELAAPSDPPSLIYENSWDVDL